MGGRWHRTSRRIRVLYGKGNENHGLGTGFFVNKRIISAVKRAEFVSDRISWAGQVSQRGEKSRGVHVGYW
jgi:hypothetical protein